MFIGQFSCFQKCPFLHRCKWWATFLHLQWPFLVILYKIKFHLGVFILDEWSIKPVLSGMEYFIKLSGIFHCMGCDISLSGVVYFTEWGGIFHWVGYDISLSGMWYFTVWDVIFNCVVLDISRPPCFFCKHIFHKLIIKAIGQTTAPYITVSIHLQYNLNISWTGHISHSWTDLTQIWTNKCHITKCLCLR